MRNLIVLITLFAVGCSEFTRSPSGPLKYSAPLGWKVKYDGKKGVGFYSATPAEPGFNLLMFSKWPFSSESVDISTFVGKLAEEFRSSIAKFPYTFTNSQPQIEQLAGASCSGRYVVFQFKMGEKEILQAMFMLNVEGEIWNGQFTGSPQDWTRSLELLKSLERVR